MSLNWNFQRGGGGGGGGGEGQTKKLSVGRVWIFSGTTHSNFLQLCQTIHCKFFPLIVSNNYNNFTYNLTRYNSIFTLWH